MIEDLTQAELRLIEAAKRGEVADYSDGNAANNDPAQGASWNGERALRGEMVRQLCLGLNPKWTVDPRGIRILGARIAADLDLSGANITFPFELERCHVAGSLFLRDVMAMRLSFSGSWLVDGLQAGGLVTKGNVFLNGGFAAKGEVRLLGADIGGVLACGQGSFENPDGEALSADGMTVKGDVFLNNGFAAKGQVRFLGADIGGDLACSQGTFEIPDGDALSADRMTVKGTVFLNDGFTAKGKVRFAGADIGSNLACSQGTFENPDGEALSADGITVKGGVFLNGGFTAKGKVRLLGAGIGGNLECSQGTFENPDGEALSADGMTVKGGVFLDDGFTAKGEVRLLGADIGGVLGCRQGTFENPDGNALSADRMTVKGSVFLNDGFTAKGKVRLLGAGIGGNLECSQGTFENPDGDALSADGMTVKGSVFLNDGFTAKGEVRLLGADIGGDLACRQGTFENPDGNALSADGMTVKGDVFLSNGFTAKGEVRFAGADIGGDLVCRLARFEVTPPLEIRGESAAFSLEGARVKGVLHWREVASLGRVTFAHAKVGGLNDERDSWPTPGSLDLNGFEYSEFASNAPTGSADRIAWLRRQVSFQPQPYEQAIRVLRHLGHDHDARRVAIEKQIALRESGFLNGWGNWWNWFFGVTVSYGYQPWKALIMALGFCIVGAGAFDLGHGYGLISPTDSRVYFREEFVNSQGAWLPPQYPKFNAPIYSVDVFLPIVDLHQESRWLPNMRNNWGWALWLYMWVHILSGWALTSVFVAALTGIIKKD